MKIKAVVFDLDGTLVNSIDGLAFAMNKVLKSNRFPVRNMETYKSLIGTGVRELVRKAIPAGTGEEELDRYVKEMREEYLKSWDYKMTVYEGIEELLGYLQAQGISFAVDTNKVDDVARLIIERFFPDFRFSCVMGSKPGLPHKPDPARANLIAGQLGMLPEQCIYLGDSEVDIMTAKNAGMISVSAAWGFRKVEDLVSAHAVNIIQEPRKLVDLLQKF